MDFQQQSRHAHADLLSVDIAGHNKNLVVDPGGYVHISHTSVINTFNADYFRQLYGYVSPHNSFDTARHYFKGTAAHNTVYIDQQDQAEYRGDYKWLGLENLSALPLNTETHAEFDFVSAGYIKDTNDAVSHRRSLLYLKPLLDNAIENDYWIFTDRVRFENLISEHRTEQVWHISPDQNQMALDDETGVFRGENFWIIPLMQSERPMPEAELIAGYHLPDQTLFETKILKFTKKGSTHRNFNYLTIIFPFGMNRKLVGATIEKMPVSDRSFVEVRDEEAQAFHLSFTTNAGGSLQSFDDYCIISHMPEKTFLWDGAHDGTLDPADARMEFFRYQGTQLVKSLVSNWSDSINPLEQAVDQFELKHNYPNPFNSSTVIRYALARREHVSLKIFNVLGQEIRTLINHTQIPGAYSAAWDGSDDRGVPVANGVFLCVLRVGNFSATQKMILLK